MLYSGMSYITVRDTLLEVRNKPFAQTRGGSTASGYTLETNVFGKSEDNHRRADVDGTEIKSKIGKLSGRQRLFTANFGCEQWLTNFGYVNKDDKLCFTRSVRVGKPISVKHRETGQPHVMELTCDDQSVKLAIAGGDQIVVHQIPLPKVTWQLAAKITNLCIVKTERATVDGEPHFRFNDFIYYEELDVDQWLNALRNSRVAVEFRVRGKDYGTSFNISLKDMEGLYSAVHRH
jgi:hypothetical protein